jgi:hypothetical protein
LMQNSKSTAKTGLLWSCWVSKSDNSRFELPQAEFDAKFENCGKNCPSGKSLAENMPSWRNSSFFCQFWLWVFVAVESTKGLLVGRTTQLWISNSVLVSRVRSEIRNLGAKLTFSKSCVEKQKRQINDR